MFRLTLIIAALTIAASGFASPSFADQFNMEEYKRAWCQLAQGTPDHVLDDGSSIDCLTLKAAVVITYAPQWEDAVRKSVSGAAKTGKKPAIILIYAPEDEPHLPQFRAAADQQNIKLVTFAPPALWPALKPELYVAL